MSRIVVVAATEKELAFFGSPQEKSGRSFCRGRHEIRVGFTGVGPVAAAFRIHELILACQPDWVIQAGICGYYPGSGLSVCQTVTVHSEKLADLGAVFPDGFRDIFPENTEIVNPWDGFSPYKKAKGYTVNSGATPNLPPQAAEVESMEGYSLFYVGSRLGVRFLEIRTVSNKVSPERGGWNIPLATKNLALALNDLLDRIP